MSMPLNSCPLAGPSSPWEAPRIRPPSHLSYARFHCVLRLTEEPMKTNPPWNREEAILALDLYRQIGNGG